MPRNWVTKPSLVPTTVAPSSFTVGDLIAAPATAAAYSNKVSSIAEVESATQYPTAAHRAPTSVTYMPATREAWKVILSAEFLLTLRAGCRWSESALRMVTIGHFGLFTERTGSN